MQFLTDHVLATLGGLRGGGLPPGQVEGTAFSLDLVWNIRPASAAVLYGSPDKGAIAMVGGRVPRLIRPAFLVDFTVAERVDGRRLVPLVACESEMYDRHGTGYSLDWHNNGYCFDFVKLLHSRAPVRLFTARAAGGYGLTETQRLDRLAGALDDCARDHHDYWSGCPLYVVLLPESPGRLHEVRLGIGRPDGGIDFARLPGSVR